MKYKLTFSEGTREEDSAAVAFTDTKEDAEFIKALFDSQGDRFKKCDFEPVDELPLTIGGSLREVSSEQEIRKLVREEVESLLSSLKQNEYTLSNPR